MRIIVKQINIEISKEKNLFLFFRNLEHLIKMIIKIYSIHIRTNAANKIVSLFGVDYFNEGGFYLIFLIY